MTHTYVLVNRATGQVVMRGRSLATLRCQRPLWIEFYSKMAPLAPEMRNADLKIALASPVDAAPPAPVEYGHVGDEPDDDTAALGL